MPEEKEIQKALKRLEIYLGGNMTVSTLTPNAIADFMATYSQQENKKLREAFEDVIDVANSTAGINNGWAIECATKALS